MKTLFFLFSIIVASCSSSKTNNNAAFINQQDSSKNNIATPLPPCLQKMISQFKAEEKQNPPREIYSYLYNGQTVYYVTAPCCDFFSDLYDSSCALTGHPDGGFSGKGDGRMTDFKEKRSNEKLIWKDDRK